jgi:lincosamide nucleotidyltransferase A/C/D/E
MIEDWRPVRSEIAGDQGTRRRPPDADPPDRRQSPEESARRNLHTRGTLRVSGHISERPVIVASAARLRELRMGYPTRDIDHHDLAQTRRARNILYCR